MGQGRGQAVGVDWLGGVRERGRPDAEVRREVVLDVSVSEALELEVVERVESLRVVGQQQRQVVSVVVALDVSHDVVFHAFDGLGKHFVLLNLLFLLLEVSLGLVFVYMGLSLICFSHVLIELLLEKVVGFGAGHRVVCQKFLWRSV